MKFLYKRLIVTAYLELKSLNCSISDYKLGDGIFTYEKAE